MKKDELLSISPLDGRYAKLCTEISAIFSEYNLIKNRLFVEISWFIYLSNHPQVKELPKLSAKSQKYLISIVENFDIAEAKKIKKIEETTKHDVKAVEYYIKSKINEFPSIKKYKEFVHIFCTSEDINNLSHALMIKEGLRQILIDLKEIKRDIKKKSKQYAKVAMLSYTHGQPASPTTMGKEMSIFYKRLEYLTILLDKTRVLGKINGATGNYSSHNVSYPSINWPVATNKFINSLGLTQNTHTTQIESHDYLADICDQMAHINSILIGFSQDVWTYISKNYFSQKNVKGEIGSSTMPHKINPINFENAEGNLGMANSMFKFFSSKLVISRLQRDLSDSTVLRNVGVAFGYSKVSYKNLLTGLSKIIINQEQIKDDLDTSWEILAEPIQMIARKYSQDDPYELLKKYTRGQKLNKSTIHEIISKLNIPEKEKAKLFKLKPSDYIGYAAILSNE